MSKSATADLDGPLRGHLRVTERNYGVSLIPRSFTTLPHFSYSDFMKAPSDSGVPPTGVAPDLTSFSCTSGSLSASLSPLLSLAITAGGVFAGANNAYQFDASVLG